MGAEPEEEGLIVTDGEVPVLRAGYANMLWFCTLVASVLLNQVLKDVGAAPFIRGVAVTALCVAAWKMYNQYVSRIFIKDGSTLVIVGPLAETHVHADDIVATDVSVHASAFTVVLKVTRRGSLFPAFCYFVVAPVTNYGGCADSGTRLRLLLKRLADVQA